MRKLKVIIALLFLTVEVIIALQRNKGLRGSELKNMEEMVKKDKQAYN